MKVSVLLFVFFFCFFYKTKCFNFGERFKVCHRNDAELEKCLADAIENGYKTLGSTGLPAMNMPAIDPLKITSITIGAGTSAVNLIQKYYNVKLTGLATLKVENAHLDLEKHTLSYSTYHPIIQQEAEYDINGKIMVLPVFGKGDSTIKFTNAELKHVISFQEEKKNNKNYFKVTKYTLDIKIKRAFFDFKNLYNGDKLLADNILKVVNDNWDVLFQDVKEGVENAFAQSFKEIAELFFNKISVDDMLPN